MHIRSNDSRPRIFFNCATGIHSPIPRRDLKKYGPDEIVTTVSYRIPIIGTKGNVILDEKFDWNFRKFDTLNAGIVFYNKRMISYRARLDARYETIYQKNRAYFDNVRMDR